MMNRVHRTRAMDRTLSCTGHVLEEPEVGVAVAPLDLMSRVRCTPEEATGEARGLPEGHLSLPPASGQTLQDESPYGCGVGLAAHLAHDRADKCAGGLDLAVTHLLGRVRICGDRLVDGSLQSA